MAEQPFDDITLSLLFLHKRRADKNKGYPSNFLLLLEILVLFKTWCLTGSSSLRPAAKASSLGQPFSTADQAGNHQGNVTLCPAH